MCGEDGLRGEEKITPGKTSRVERAAKFAREQEQTLNIDLNITLSLHHSIVENI